MENLLKRLFIVSASYIEKYIMNSENIHNIFIIFSIVFKTSLFFYKKINQVIIKFQQIMSPRAIISQLQSIIDSKSLFIFNIHRRDQSLKKSLISCQCLSNGQYITSQS